MTCTECKEYFQEIPYCELCQNNICESCVKKSKCVEDIDHMHSLCDVRYQNYSFE